MQPQASVLVIDDEEVVRSLLAESLAADGFEVETAGSGRAAIEALRRRRFDLAITDLKMPGMDGIQTLRALKEADREIQVVVMTGYASLDTAVGALKGGACDYIEKPFRPLEIGGVLRKAIGRSALEGLLATYGASRVLIATMGHPELCRTTVDLAEAVFHADTAGLLVRHTDSSPFEMHTRGRGAAPGAELLRALVRQAEILGRPYGLPSDEEEVENLLDADLGFSAAMVYPLMEEGRFFGALCLLRRPPSRSFSAGDLQRGILLSSEASRALVMSRMRQRSEASTADAGRLAELLRRANGAALEGRLTVGMARRISQPLRRLAIGMHTLEEAFAGLSEITEAASLEPAPGGIRSGDGAGARRQDRGQGNQADSEALLEQTSQALAEAREASADATEILEAIQRCAGSEGAHALVDLDGVVGAAIETMRDELEGIAEISLEDSGLPPVRCHPGGIGTVLLCLLDNAAEAVRAVVGNSGEKGRITVRIAGEGGSAVISVHDTGSGIPEQTRARVFDSWFTTGDRGRLAGLGLTLAREIVEVRHRGSLTFESKPGAGTTFSARIPLAT